MAITMYDKASTMKEDETESIKADFINYNPKSFDIVNDFKEIDIIYAERLGTAKLTLVEHNQTGKVSLILFINY